MWFQHLVFYVFSAMLLFSGVMVIISRNTMHGVLFLVLAFVCSAVLWMLLQAEFLSLVLIFVYVGAVMTLFLFVVMMLNIDLAPQREGFVRYLPFCVLAMLVLVGLMVMAILPKHFALASDAMPVMHPENYSNVKAIGNVLYTEYLYPFELAAVLLLIAIIAAISLAFRGRRSKTQDVRKQVEVKKQDRLKIVKMGAKGPSQNNFDS